MTPSRPLHPDSPWLLALLAALVALGPLSIDMYLPAMPIMREALGTDISHMHLTMSAYLAGFSLFHLLCGPLSDRFGRRPILLGGTALFVLACLGCAQATEVYELMAYRFIQGVGACVGPTLARAMVRDMFGPSRAARALSIIAMLMALAPAVAPLLGGIALLVLPWPSIFLFLAAYGLVMIFLIHRVLAESLPERQSLHPLAISRNYAELVRDPGYLAAVTASGLVYAGFLTYLSSSSFVFMGMYGVPQQYFGLIFLTSVIGYITGSGISARLSGNHSSEWVMLCGAILAVTAACLTWLTWSLQPHSIFALMLPMVLYSIAMGLVLPHAMTIALRPYPHIAGTAAALLGFVQMALSGAATAAIGVALLDSPAPMLWMMILISLAALALTVPVYRRRLN